MSKSEYYNGTSCAGSAFASVTEPAISGSFNGTKTIGADTVDKVTFTVPAGTPTFTGTARVEPVLCGGVPSIVVPLSSSLQCSHITTTTFTIKTILFLSSNGNAITIGDTNSSSSFDAEEFPNALLNDSTGIYNKQ